MSSARPVGISALLALFLVGCPSVPPPASQFPSAADAIARMKATYACERGVHGEAKFDHFSEQGRVRGTLLLYAARPASLRLDVLSPPPFQSIVATLTSDGRRFSLSDMREKKFYEGPADACNIARLTQVPIPGHALVTLLGGQAPLLVHDDATLSIEWSRRGYYVVRIPSTRDAVEEVRLVPTPADLGKPWGEQRVRVLDVRVTQQGVDLYHAALGEHAPAAMSAALVDPDGLEAPVPPSGPVCSVEVPRKIEVEIPDTDQDMRLRYEDVKVNPPLPDGVFSQPVPAGVERRAVDCR